MYEIRIKSGNTVKMFKNENDQAIISINGVEYDLEAVISVLEEKQDVVTPSDILDFEEDPEMRAMVEESEKDIEEGRVYSTQQILEKIRRG
jgi:hypothetical protein